MAIRLKVLKMCGYDEMLRIALVVGRLRDCLKEKYRVNDRRRDDGMKKQLFVVIARKSIPVNS